MAQVWYSSVPLVLHMIQSRLMCGKDDCQCRQNSAELMVIRAQASLRQQNQRLALGLCLGDSSCEVCCGRKGDRDGID